MNIINAKFSPTKLDKALVQRSELLNEMERDKSKKIILVNAPAGYGKTTLLSQFSHMTDEKVIWYHLDALDDEMVTFMTYLTEGIARCFGKHQEDILSISTDRLNQEDIREQVAELLNYLSQNCSYPLCIIIDDYHYITSETIHNWLSIFIKYLPLNIRVIIASRIYPAIDVDYLLTSNQLMEISIDRLKFTNDEEKTFIEKIKPIDQEVFNKDLIQKNNGWPFGLSLLKHAFVKNTIGDYKIQELYKRCFDNLLEQFEDQDFLLTTCILEVLDVEACNYLTNRTNSEETLKRMYKKGLFISKTYSEGYKYHDLFRDYLLEKVRDKKNIYKKIANYYESKDNRLEAIDYYFLSEEYAKADELLKHDQYKYISISYYIKIYHWEKKISNKVAMKYGSFSLIKALIALKDYHVDIGVSFIERAGEIFINQKDEAGILKTDIIWVKVLGIRQKFEEAYALANTIYKRLLTSPLDEKMDILTDKLNVGAFLCKIEDEYNVLKKETAYIDETNIKHFEIQALALLEYAAYLIGDYKTAMSIQGKYRDKISPLNSIVYTIRIYMVWGHLTEGKAHIQKEIENAKRFGLNLRLPELYGILAELEFHMGNYGEAEKHFKEAMHLFEDQNHNLYHLCIFTYINMVAFLGRRDEALEMINIYYPKIPKENHLGLMMAEMMLCQTYLILKNYDLAIEYANKAMVPSKMFGTKLYMATLNSVIATSFIALDELEKAMEPAKVAMDFSKRGYYIQDYITYYAEYKPLYHFCIQNNIQVDFINEIKEIVSEDSYVQQNLKLYVRFFGDNIVKAGPNLVKWRTNKAKEIFYYLLYHHNTGVTKEKLMDIFFEHYDLDKANNNLRTSLTYIRKALAEVGFEDAIWQKNGRYFVNHQNVVTDLEEFQMIINKLEANDENINQLSQDLIDVYKGTFCEDIDIYEFNIEKEKFHSQFKKALLRSIKYLEQGHNYQEAIIQLNQLIQYQKFNEIYYNEKIRLYNLLGNDEMVRRTKEELVYIEQLNN